VLKSTAIVIQENVRAGDLAARYGGEEFCLLLPHADGPLAVSISERVRRSVEKNLILYEGKQLNVTVSLGAAQYDPDRDASAKALVDRADRAMYQSKHEGRNRVSLSA